MWLIESRALERRTFGWNQPGALFMRFARFGPMLYSLEESDLTFFSGGGGTTGAGLLLSGLAALSGGGLMLSTGLCSAGGVTVAGLSGAAPAGSTAGLASDLMTS